MLGWLPQLQSKSRKVQPHVLCKHLLIGLCMFVYRQTSDYSLFIWTSAAVQLRFDMEKYGHVSIISDFLRLLEILHYFPTREEAVLGLELAMKIRLDMELALLPPRRFAEPIPPLEDKDTITSMTNMANLLSCKELRYMYGNLHRTAKPHIHSHFTPLWEANATIVHALRSTWSKWSAKSGSGYHTRLHMVRCVRDLTK
jgi:hypothetical protein